MGIYHILGEEISSSDRATCANIQRVQRSTFRAPFQQHKQARSTRNSDDTGRGGNETLTLCKQRGTQESW